MGLYRYSLFTFAFIALITYFSMPAYAGDSCGFSNPQEDLGVKPICKNKSIDTLLSAETTQPDFSDVNDILQGVRTILPVQDLVLMSPTARTPGQSEEDVIFSAIDFSLLTDNVAVTDFIGPDFIQETQCNPSGPQGPIPYGIPSPQQTNPARMFNIDRDVVVTYASNSNSFNRCQGNVTVTTQDPMGLLTIPDLNFNSPSIYSREVIFLQSTVDDFNFDGYDDILIIRGGVDSGMFIITAVDPEDPEAGLTVGPFGSFPFVLGSVSDRNAMSSPVSGDFNGDGIVDVAWIGSEAIDGAVYKVFFASICPVSTPNIPLCEGRSEFEVILDPLSSEAIEIFASVGAGSEFSYPASALAAGDFNTNTEQSAGDDLIVVYGQPIAGYSVLYYTFDNTMAPTFRDSIGQTFLLYNVYAETAQFDPTKPNEQVVIAQQINNGCPLWLLDFNDDIIVPHFSDWVGPVSGNGDCAPQFRDPSQVSLNGMALGRFTSAEPTDFQDLTPQIAVYLTTYLARSMQVRFFTVNAPTDFIPRFSNAFGTDSTFATRSFFGQSNPNRGGSFLRAGDLQGRSAVLGSPDVARVSNWIEVNTILGAPPMHTAYIQGIEQSEPRVNNFSVIPETFNTAFTTGTTQSTTETNTDQASWTWSNTQSVDTFASFQPVPLVVEIETGFSFSANQNYGCNVEEVNSSYTSTENEISTRTGFSDTVIYTESRNNIYFYPVIGQTVCVDGSDDCPPSEMRQLMYQLSAPDQISTNIVSGRTSEFYQPVHQTGNIFTYPATRTQLLDRFSSENSSVLSEPTLGFLTNNAPFTQLKRWEQGQGNECTASWFQTRSTSESISLSVGPSTIARIFSPTSAGIETKFDFTQSRSTSGNLRSTNMTTDSTGIQVNKPDEFLNPDEYQYLVNSFILGQPFPPGVWQSLFDSGQTAANISSTGPLITAFTANMLTRDSGPWWVSGGINPYIQHTDIGLNFPVRWKDESAKLGAFTLVPPECRLDNSNSEELTCTLIKQPANTPGELWSSGFYQMRGFFIRAGEEASGPSQTYVYIGDDVNLSTRVYNLSLKSMEPTDVVRVQFYAQEWDNTLNVPIGDSILIDDLTVDDIPPFTDSDVPNWKIVTTSLNTEEENMGPGKYWVFWVLVYPLDEGGNLVHEVPGYGLERSRFTPGEVFKSILDVPLEKVRIRELLVDVERSFTNNVGFYKQAVYVAPLPSNQGDDVEPTIFIDNISVEPEIAWVGDIVTVKADVFSMDAAAGGVTVLFHDRHPDDAEMAYDIEMLSNIEKDSLHNVQVEFQPEFCGEHELHVTAADKGTDNPGADIISVILNVICQPGDTNLDGKLIGPDGRPVGSGGDGNCALAPPGSKPDIPLYLFVPLMLVALRFGYRRIKSKV